MKVEYQRAQFRFLGKCFSSRRLISLYNYALTKPLVPLGDGLVQKPFPQTLSLRGLQACAATNEALIAEPFESLPERRRWLHLDREDLLPLATVDGQDLVGLEPVQGQKAMG